MELNTQPALVIAGSGGGGDTTRAPRRASIAIRPQMVDPASVLSAEELELLQHKFARFNPNANKTRSLPAADAMKLFRDDFPMMSEWETQELFQKRDLNCDGKLALHEYLQTRAYYRLVMEAENEIDIVRSFTILDTDNDGILVADEVLALVEQAKQPGARLLKQVVVQAAEATQDAANTCRSHRVRRGYNSGMANGPSRPKGEITLEHFVNTIRDINRTLEQEMATKTLRLLSLEDKLDELQVVHQDPSLSVLQRANVLAKMQSTKIEVSVLKSEIARCRKELLADAGQNSALGRICETLVATYENEQHVYECLSNLITYCGLKDPAIFRYNLEQSGREVHVLDSVLVAPPSRVLNSKEYAEMLEYSIHHNESTSQHSRIDDVPTEASGSNHWPVSRPVANNEDQRYRGLKFNATLRRQFVFYSMLADVTNLKLITRCSFLKFVKDCELHLLPGPPLTDPDIGSIFAHATGSPNSHFESPHLERDTDSALSPATARRSPGLTFTAWLIACDSIFQRALLTGTNGQLSVEELESLMKLHVAAKAKTIQTQNIAPDISQNHVLKLLREHIWQLRQIFFQFTAQSLLEVDTKKTMSMRQFLQFARAFRILCASDERDGEPYSPPPLTENPIIQPISIMKLIREFYAAKLDISFSNPTRRDRLDLNLREFVRCIQRIALAMHAHTESTKTNDAGASNGILTTSFKAVKEDEDRSAKHTEAPLYHRRGNIVGSLSLPTKNCKMTSTSLISKLLHSSRAIAANVVSGEKDGGISSPPRIPTFKSRSPTKIFYGLDVASSAIPFIPPASLEAVANSRQIDILSSRLKSSATEPWVPPYRPVSVPPSSSKVPPSPRTPRRHRPITCGGPAVVRVIKAPDGR